MADEYWEPLDVKTHMLILLLPLILINYVRNLKLLAPFSTLANAITFVGLAMILVYMFDDLPSPSEREMFGTLRGFPLYFGTTLFALEAVGVVRVAFNVLTFIFSNYFNLQPPTHTSFYPYTSSSFLFRQRDLKTSECKDTTVQKYFKFIVNCLFTENFICHVRFILNFSFSVLSKCTPL